MEADAVFPAPPSLDVTGPLVLSLRPVAVPVTLTVTVQLDAGPAPPPARAMPEPPGEAVTAPPHVVAAPGKDETWRPAGSVSENPIPESAALEFGFAIVNVSGVEPPTPING